MKFRHALIATLILAAPAFAQDGSETIVNRTPASAQKLIIALRPYRFGGAMKFHTTTAISSPEACKTELVGDELDLNVDQAEYVPVPGATGKRFVIDWSKVQKVDVRFVSKAYFILLFTPNSDTPDGWTLGYQLEETRDRVLAAARYLQTACDMTKDTGF